MRRPTIQVVRSQDDLQGDLERNVHISHVLGVLVLLVVVEVLHDHLEHFATVTQSVHASQTNREVVAAHAMFSNWQVFVLDSRNPSASSRSANAFRACRTRAEVRTGGIEHSSYGAADAGRRAFDDE